jgi:hypothetical protein
MDSLAVVLEHGGIGANLLIRVAGEENRPDVVMEGLNAPPCPWVGYNHDCCSRLCQGLVLPDRNCATLGPVLPSLEFGILLLLHSDIANDITSVSTTRNQQESHEEIWNKGFVMVLNVLTLPTVKVVVACFGSSENSAQCHQLIWTGPPVLANFSIRLVASAVRFHLKVVKMHFKEVD